MARIPDTMMKIPNDRWVEFVRATYIGGQVVQPPEKRKFPTAFASELVSGGKAKFADPDPEPLPKPAQPAANAVPDEIKTQLADSAKKGK